MSEYMLKDEEITDTLAQFPEFKGQWHITPKDRREEFLTRWRAVAGAATEKVFRLQREAVPEKIREKIARWLRTYKIGAEEGTGADDICPWEYCGQKINDFWLEEADRILSLIAPLLEQAREKEREKLTAFVDKGCGHYDRDWIGASICAECWQALKEGKEVP